MHMKSVLNNYKAYYKTGSKRILSDKQIMLMTIIKIIIIIIMYKIIVIIIIIK